MATVDLDNIQFYSPNPPPSRPCGAFKPIISTDMPTGNHLVYTLPSAVPTLSKTSTRTKTPGRLECSFTSAEAPALTDSAIQHRLNPPHAAPSDSDKLLDWPEVSGIGTIERTDDNSLDSLLSWFSEELCWTPSPGSSFLPLEDLDKRSNLSNETLFVPQSPFLDDDESVAVSARSAGLSGATFSAATYDPYTFTDQLGSDGTLDPVQPHVHPGTFAPSTCSTLQPERDSEASGSAQRQKQSDPQPPRHARIEVVIPSSGRGRSPDSPALEIPDSQGSTRRRSSPDYDGERHDSPGIERVDSNEENDPLVPPVKRRRVTSRSSARHRHRPTVPVSAAKSSTDGRPRRKATRQGISEGGKGADPILVRPSRRGDGEHGQDGRAGSSLHIENHFPRSAEEAMTLAAAVAHELYSLLMRPPTSGTVAPDNGESMSPHTTTRYKERVSDRGGTWTRWSKEDDEKLLSLRHKNIPWKDIEERFPCRTLRSLQQRYWTLNNVSLTGNRGRRRSRKSK